MDILLVLTATLSLVKQAYGFSRQTVQIIQFFIGDDSNNGLTKILAAIGKSNFDAAIRALEDAKKSNDPRREFESALTLLRGAYEELSSHESRSTTALLIAACYSCFTEKEQRLIESYIEKSNQEFKEYAKEYISKKKKKADGKNFLKLKRQLESYGGYHWVWV